MRWRVHVIICCIRVILHSGCFGLVFLVNLILISMGLPGEIRLKFKKKIENVLLHEGKPNKWSLWNVAE